jgi:hypothetical protein
MSTGSIIRLEGFDFLVPSDVLGRDPYKVSLTMYGGNGKCVCKHFDTFCYPNLKRSGVINDEMTRCKHLRRARNSLVDEILKKYSEQQNKQNNGKHEDE